MIEGKALPPQPRRSRGTAIVHALPGRFRLSDPRLRGRPDRAETARLALFGVPGVTHAEASAVTATALLRCAPGVAPSRRLSLAPDGRGMRTMAKRAKGDASEPTSAIAVATVVLSLGRTKATHEFEEVSISTDDPANVTVLPSSADGRKLAVILPRAEVKRLLTWRRARRFSTGTTSSDPRPT